MFRLANRLGPCGHEIAKLDMWLTILSLMRISCVFLLYVAWHLSEPILSVYLECKGKCSVFKSGSDSNFLFVVVFGYPDTGRDQSQAGVIVGVVDQTDLALDFALGNDSNVGILLGVECGVVSRDSEGDAGLVKKADERSKHVVVIVVGVVVVVLKFFQ
ncbi:hypothetical protein K457DRAFT_259929 [Linnemannia elongata AG-77]|uniref:Uncharacterized protein n=1 Tax=Linnemannia elongata AG-77 TaxID=1314771 RepID=A0A197JDB4_9FUNG|nr:hypothetical protein K457DRAFT_259929 [Linnemannia elongata AG-77]